MKRLLPLLLLACSPAYGQVSFSQVNGTDSGLDAIAAAWLPTISNPKDFWGAFAIDYDNDGDSDVGLTVHYVNSPSLIICKNLFVETGTVQFEDVTAQVFPGGYAGLPDENKPHVWDADNDGDLDLLCGTRNKSWRNNGDGTFSIATSAAFPAGQTCSTGERGIVLGDFNSDGLTDWYKAIQDYAVSVKQTGINNGDCTFTVTSETVALPAELPQVVHDRYALSLANTASGANSFNGKKGPEIDTLDVNGDGLIDTVLNFEGGYNGENYFYVCLRQTDGTLVASNAALGLPIEGCSVISFQDASGDGLPDLLTYPGGSSTIVAASKPNGSPTVNEKQVVMLYNQPASGTYKLKFGGQTTVTLPHNSTAAEVDAALESLSTIGVGNVQCTGGPFPAHIIVEFVGVLANTNVATITSTALTFPAVNHAGLWIQQPGGMFDKSANTAIATLLKADSRYTAIEWWEDFDQDGDPDLVISKTLDSVGGVFENNGSGTFTQILSLTYWGAEGIYVRSVAGHAADFNADGLTDILACGTNSDISTTPLNCWLNTSVATPPPPPEPMGFLVPMPAHDPESAAFKRLLTRLDAGSVKSAWPYAMAWRVTGKDDYRTKAIELASAIVAANTVAGDQYLQSGRQFRDVFCVLDWCKPSPQQRAEWLAWGKRHLGAPDGSVSDSLWKLTRWAREKPGNNYYHSFCNATSYYAMASGDGEWLDWMREDRLPKLHAYYSTTPEGGSREGTGYGESHRSIFELAKLWRDYDGTAIVPQEFINGSLRYWVHAIAPGQQWVALIGAQTRSHGRVDSYHRHLLGSALAIADDAEAMDDARWELSQLKPITASSFVELELVDFPAGTPPNALEYHAAGAGHFFARTSWEADASYLYCVCGRFDEPHAQQDQGAFGIFDAGRWQTCSDTAWTKVGTIKENHGQNIVSFGGLQIRPTTNTLTWRRSDGTLIVDMNASEAAGQEWRRRLWWTGSSPMFVRDWCEASAAEWHFAKPSEDDDAAPYVSGATATTGTLADGFLSAVEW